MKTIVITGFACVTFITGLAMIGDVPVSVALTVAGTSLAIATGSKPPLG